MKPNHPAPTPFEHGHNKVTEAPSRFQDEKISDDSGAETTLDSAHAPTGLDNPFWN
jgi:hypothetical protein